MRDEPPFSRPQCGDSGIGGDRCLRCKIDASGAALFDDDACTLASPTQVDLAWNEPISIVLQDGAEVEILGAAARKPSSAYPDLAQSAGYREAPSILAFDGSPEQRVLLMASPRSGG